MTGERHSSTWDMFLSIKLELWLIYLRKRHLKHVLYNKGRRELNMLPKMQRRFNEAVIDWAGGELVISPCGWITWGRKEENELWSINLFIHNYPLSLSQSASLSHTVLCYTWLNGTKLTSTPWRHSLSAKCLIVFFSQHLSQSSERTKEAPWWYHWY